MSEIVINGCTRRVEADQLSYQDLIAINQRRPTGKYTITWSSRTGAGNLAPNSPPIAVEPDLVVNIMITGAA